MTGWMLAVTSPRAVAAATPVIPRDADRSRSPSAPFAPTPARATVTLSSSSPTSPVALTPVSPVSALAVTVPVAPVASTPASAADGLTPTLPTSPVALTPALLTVVWPAAVPVSPVAAAPSRVSVRVTPTEPTADVAATPVSGRLLHSASSHVPTSQPPFATDHHAIRRRAVEESLVGIVNVNVPLVTVWLPNVYTATALSPWLLL